MGVLPGHVNLLLLLQRAGTPSDPHLYACAGMDCNPRYPWSFEVAPNCINHDAPNAKKSLKNKNYF